MSLPAAQLRLPPLLSGPDDVALRALERYYRRGPSSTGFTGRWFDTWDPDGRRSENADRFTDADFTAVSHLSVAVPPRAAVRLMYEQAGEIAELLAAVSPDLNLADVPPGDITPDWPVWQLWRLLRSGRDGLGPTITSKLLARKRPRLVPVQDRVTTAVLGVTEGYWAGLNAVLRADGRALHRRLADLHQRAGLPEDVSPLRVFDVLVWMSGDTSR